MILTGTILAVIALLYVGVALAQTYRFGIEFRQALLYLPLKLAWRIRDSRIRLARQAEPPVIYAVAHQSRLDPALMLALLPAETLHILDEASATSSWLEPRAASMFRSSTISSSRIRTRMRPTPTHCGSPPPARVK